MEGKSEIQKSNSETEGYHHQLHASCCLNHFASLRNTLELAPNPPKGLKRQADAANKEEQPRKPTFGCNCHIAVVRGFPHTRLALSLDITEIPRTQTEYR